MDQHSRPLTRVLDSLAVELAAAAVAAGTVGIVEVAFAVAVAVAVAGTVGTVADTAVAAAVVAAASAGTAAAVVAAAPQSTACHILPSCNQPWQAKGVKRPALDCLNYKLSTVTSLLSQCHLQSPRYSGGHAAFSMVLGMSSQIGVPLQPRKHQAIPPQASWTTYKHSN